MKKYVALCLMISSLGAAKEVDIPAGYKLLDRMLAEVGSKPILKSVVDEKVSRGPLVVVSDFPADEKSPPSTRALNDLVNLELILARAKDLGIEVEDERIDDQIKRLLDYNHMSISDLDATLRAEGKSMVEYRDDLRHQMVFMRFRGREIVPKVKITERDTQAAYIKKTKGGLDAVDLFIRQIFIEIPSGSIEAIVDAKTKLAEDIYAKLKDGMSFIEAERLYSDIGSGKASEKPHKIGLSDLPSELKPVVAALEPGGFSRPLKTKNGLLFVYLEDRVFGSSDDYQKQRDAIEQELRTTQMNSLTRQWLQSERTRVKIKELES